MKKISLRLLTAVCSLLCVAFALVLGGCKSCNDAQEQAQKPITLNTETLELSVGDEYTFTASNEDGAVTAEWLSSDMRVVLIDESGKARALSAGTATVTAKYGLVSATATVTVKQQTQTDVQVEFSLNFPALSLYVGESAVLQVNATANGITETAQAFFTVADGTVCKAENGKITALALGQTTVSVTASYSGKEFTATVPVTVRDKVMLVFEEVNLTLPATDYDPALGKLPQECRPTQNQLSCKLYENGVEAATAPAITWTTSDDTVLDVNQNGLATVVSAGEASITVKCTVNGKEYTAVNNITVAYSVCDLSSEPRVYADIHKETDGRTSVTLPDKAYETILSVKDENGNDISCEAAIAGEVKLASHQLTKGIKTYSFFGGLFEYKLPVYTADRVISNGDEFKEMLDEEMIYCQKGNSFVSDFYDKKVFVLTDDIVITDTKIQDTNAYYGEVKGKHTTGSGLSLVGGDSYFFVHTFDGNGYSISGPQADGRNGYFFTQGLFGNMAGATVKNLIVYNALVNDTGSVRGGALAQQIQESTVENCVFVNTIVKNNGTAFSFGLMAGHLYRENTIRNNLVIDAVTAQTIPTNPNTIAPYYADGKYMTRYLTSSVDEKGYTVKTTDANAEDIVYYTEKYTADVVKKDENGNDVLDEEGNLVLEHKKGDIILNEDGTPKYILNANGEKMATVYSQVCGLFGAIGDSATEGDIYNNYCISKNGYLYSCDPNKYYVMRGEEKVLKTVPDFVNAVGEDIVVYSLITVMGKNIMVGGTIISFEEDNIGGIHDNWLN